MYKESVSDIYRNRENFAIIGLTGRTGSGCSTAADILSHDKILLPRPSAKHINDNEARKDLIIYNYIKNKWNKFTTIKATHIINTFIFDEDSIQLSLFIKGIYGVHIPHDDLMQISSQCEHFKSKWKDIQPLFSGDWDNKLAENGVNLDLCNKAIQFLDKTSEFTKLLTDKIDILLTTIDFDIVPIYQRFGDNIRRSGNPLSSDFDQKHIFSIANRINRVVKILRYISRHSQNKKEKPHNKTLIVIDTFRNPLEALWFRERYAAFYLMAINAPNEHRIARLRKNSNYAERVRIILDNKEYESKKTNEHSFISQDIQKCYEIADIHVNNPQIGEDNFTHLTKQLTKFVSLILHPGLIMPTSIERCMQIAHTAKMNSGCLSRQVGAVVTDSDFSIKAVGWNTVPHGQTPCLLRNANSLIRQDDTEAYSDYENNNKEFKEKLKLIIGEYIDRKSYDGRNISFCFKDIQNAIKEDKNQIHTRALHAEENAFLQISKYGGQGIAGGNLFTTSSPCELCSKKAYQIGIKTIYYIDPYPGIADKHILSSGSKIPKLELFNGAIGRAYHQLYEPIIPYKDELEWFFGIKKSIAEVEILRRKKRELEKRVEKLENQLKLYETETVHLPIKPLPKGKHKKPPQK